MLGQRLTRMDRIVIQIAAFGAVVMLLGIFNEGLLIRYFISQQIEEKKIGNVVIARNDVRRRLRQSLTWYPMSTKDNIYEQDSIFTGADSEMSLRLLSSQEVQLGPNSFAVTQAEGDDVVFDLQIGTLSAADTGSSSVKVRVGNTTAEIKAPKGANPVLINKVKSGDLSILSQSEGVEVKIKGQVTKMSRSESLSIDRALNTKKKSYPVRITSHKLNDKLWIKRTDTIRFEWVSIQKLNSAKIQIAKDANFKNISEEQALTDTQQAFSWQPEKLDKVYYLRVIDKDTSEPISFTHTLNINEQRPIALYYPYNLEVLYPNRDIAPGTELSLGFGWEKVKDISSYFLEIARDKDYFSVVQSVTVENNYADLKLTKGIYYWRVRTHRFVNDPFMSASYKFSLGKPGEGEDMAPRMYGPERPPSDFNAEDSTRVAQKPQTVTLKFSPETKLGNTQSLKRGLINPPQLTWEAMPGAAAYKIQIDTSTQFNKSVVYDNIESNKFLWRDVTPGTFYWRVIGKNSEDVESQPSSSVKLVARVQSPEIELPQNLSEEVRDPSLLSSAKKIDLIWNDVPYAKIYRVEFLGKAFTQTDKSLSVQVLPNQKQVVKIVALDEREVAISEPAETEFVFKRTLKLDPPELVLPANNTTVVAFDKSKMSPLLLSWSKSQHAKQYTLQLSSDQNFSKIIQVEAVNTNRFLLSKQPTVNKVYWRVQSRYKENVSPWSKVRTFTIQVSQ